MILSLVKKTIVCIILSRISQQKYFLICVTILLCNLYILYFLLSNNDKNTKIKLNKHPNK